jgi:hypothetical protein
MKKSKKPEKGIWAKIRRGKGRQTKNAPFIKDER